MYVKEHQYARRGNWNKGESVMCRRRAVAGSGLAGALDATVFPPVKAKYIVSQLVSLKRTTTEAKGLVLMLCV